MWGGGASLNTASFDRDLDLALIVRTISKQAKGGTHRDQITGGPLLLLVAKPPIFPHTHIHSFPAAATGKAGSFPKTTTQ